MDDNEEQAFGPGEAATILATDHSGLIALVDSGQLDTIPGRRANHRRYRQSDLWALFDYWGQRLPDVLGTLEMPPVDGVNLSLAAEVAGFTLVQARAWVHRHRLLYFGILEYDVVLSRPELLAVAARCFPGLAGEFAAALAAKPSTGPRYGNIKSKVLAGAATL